MTVALGASAYSVAIFHLMTHAFFKALLFLAAGSVIIGMHHDQDIRHMGGLRKYMPITWITSLLGSLALIGTPFFSGFYSKDLIIEAVRASEIPGSGFATFAVLAGVFVTAFYSFRMYFLVFHGKERFDPATGKALHAHGHGHDDDHGHDDHPSGPPHESPSVITLPLVLLAIPSVVIGAYVVGPMVFGGFFDDVITVADSHRAMASIAGHFHGWVAMGLHSVQTLVFWLAVAGVAAAYYCYLVNPRVPESIARTFSGVYRVLDNKYYLDRINEVVFAGGARLLGSGFWKVGDQALIDGLAVNGSARLVGWFAGVLRWVQSGFVYHYAIAMIVGVALLVWWFVPLTQR
jgi:NADH-quinone oxidoreductase subunit L